MSRTPSWTASWTAPAVAAILVASLVGCAGPRDASPSSSRIPEGCGGCEQELAAFTEAVKGIPGVATVRGARLSKRGVPVSYLSVGVDLSGKDVVSTDLEAVTDAVAEAAWRSEVSPLDVLTVRLSLRDGYQEVDSYPFGADRATYRERWGERPAGAVWSPVPEADDLQGCEVDGCTAVMREIARQASALPGVDVVLGSSYVPATPTNDAYADIELTSSGGDDTSLADAVAELVWRSEVTPLDRIAVTVQPPGGAITPSTDYAVGPGAPQRAELEARWGPRPVD